jgi:hypothetical protein
MQWVFQPTLEHVLMLSNQTGMLIQTDQYNRNQGK